MGCGCKKKKAKAAAAQTAQARSTNQPINPSAANITAVEETKEYQGKVRDALKQLMEIKRRKRTPKR
tara:strand:+ start:99 stop:299 length:201 start_codon:yes stop_codon:yes gene_type:complete